MAGPRRATTHEGVNKTVDRATLCDEAELCRMAEAIRPAVSAITPRRLASRSKRTRRSVGRLDPARTRKTTFTLRRMLV